MAQYEQLDSRRRSEGSVENLTTPDREQWHKLKHPETIGQRYARHTMVVAKYIILHVLVPFLSIWIALRLSEGHSRGHGRDEFILERTYGSDARFMSLDKKFDYVWADDMKLNIYPLPKDGSLGPEVDIARAQGIETGSIAMFHNLHCLAMIRMTLQEAHYGNPPGLDYHDDDHWPHCLHHLRKAILCHADDVVELPKWNNGSLGAPLVSGVADVRHCRSSDAMYQLRDRLVSLG
ncbi:Hypothetical predicted protein [Lecanosticta acicola]|uniref:Uncharacterized protein n=1 Tax=Lecanosticta acicola TaxID=111012 RepID=A0AAI8W1G6_9PEZI|nr:Hypothetical predicted protein [Lecanosticta acicola]